MHNTGSQRGIWVAALMFFVLPFSAFADVLPTTANDGDGVIAREIVLSCNPDLNLFRNAGFETPEVASGGWNIFGDLTINPSSLLGWLVSWVTPHKDGRLGLEIQAGVAGTPLEGRQLAELDGDHPTKISQAIATIPGKQYEVSFDFSARPGYTAADNPLQVSLNGRTLGDPISADGSTATDTVWTHYVKQFVAEGDLTTIEFADLGIDNSLGTYLDNTNLHCTGDPIPEPVPQPPVTGGGGGSANFDYWGCVNKEALNFNPLANRDDGSCQLPPPPPQPEVLGASTTKAVEVAPQSFEDVCAAHKSEVLRYGEGNDMGVVSELQSFLNKQLTFSVFVSGIYNTKTHDAVKKLEDAHKNEILTPWATQHDHVHDLKYWLLLSKCGELNFAPQSL